MTGATLCWLVWLAASPIAVPGVSTMATTPATAAHRFDAGADARRAPFARQSDLGIAIGLSILEPFYDRNAADAYGMHIYDAGIHQPSSRGWAPYVSMCTWAPRESSLLTTWFSPDVDRHVGEGSVPLVSPVEHEGANRWSTRPCCTRFQVAPHIVGVGIAAPRDAHLGLQAVVAADSDWSAPSRCPDQVS